MQCQSTWVSVSILVQSAASQLRQHHHSGKWNNLRLLLILFQFGYQTFGAELEIAVLGCVDERVDDAVDEHQHEEAVVPISIVNSKLAVVADSR